MSRSATGDTARRSILGALLGAALLTFALPALAIDVQLEPHEIALGDEAELSITVEGDGELPQLPPIDGVDVRNTGRSTQIQIVNGAVSRHTRVVYALRPRRTGEFTIPAFEVASGPGNPLSPGPLVLRVVSSSASPRAAAPPDPLDASQGGPPPADAAARDVRLELALASGDLYVGQLEPVALRLLVPEGVQLTEVSQPRIRGAGFTLSPFADAEPVQSHTVIDGVPTQVLTWTAAVSAVKPGSHGLEAEIDAVALVHEPERSRRSRLRGMLDAPFSGHGSLLDSLFGARRRSLHLASDPLEVRVASLPDAGRPEDFGGAVGDFTFATRLDATRATTGDPLALEMQVAGRGNFDRVSVPGLASNPDFKTYAPSARFEGEDDTGLAGRKRFEQVVIPEVAGASVLPSQRFSYFDPYRRSYVTLASDPLPIDVVPGAMRVASDPTAAEGTIADPDAPLALRSDLGRLAPPGVLIFQRPVAGIVASVPLVLLLAAAIVAWRRQRSADPRRQEALALERTVRESVAALDDACSRADAAAFFRSARRAILARVGARLSRNPDSLTRSEVEAGLRDQPTVLTPLRSVLDEVDAYAYAGQVPDVRTLDASRTRVLAALALLEGNR